MGKILVTTYTNPDLDGVACAIAYSELLNKTGKAAAAGIFGEINDETRLVIKKFRIRHPSKGSELIDDAKEIVLVDVSSAFGLSEKIDISKVIEFIDHHKLSMEGKLDNAKVQLELVGAAATLIAERFQKAAVEPSKEAAALLYYAIVSNTINFNNNVTTQKDIGMADWLSLRFDYKPGYTDELFALKSAFAKPVAEVISAELARQEFSGKKVGISQLEIVDTVQFVNENLDAIKDVLRTARKELDYAFLSCVDIKDCRTRFVVADKESRIFAEDVLGVRFRNDKANQKGILMRKEIWPLVKQKREEK